MNERLSGAYARSVRPLTSWGPVRRADSAIRRRLDPDLFTAGGHWFANDPTDTIGLGQGVDWEPFETGIVSQLVGRGDTVVDVGAHIGHYTLALARVVGRRGRVIAFEPDRENRLLLEGNVRLNGYRNVTVEPAAIGARTGTATLYRSLDNRGDNRIVDPGEDRPTESVPCTSLDDYAAQHGLTVDLVKMDIQGAEADALDGMERLFETSPRLVLFCEFWPWGLARAGISPEGFLERLRELGLHVVHLDAESRRLEPADAQDLVRRFPAAEFGRHTNLLCARDAGRFDGLTEAVAAAEPAAKPQRRRRAREGLALPRRLWFRAFRRLRDLLVAFSRRSPSTVDRIEERIKRVFPEDVHPFPSGVLRSLIKRVQPIFLDYPVYTRPRWGFGSPPHPELSAFFEERSAEIRKVLESFLPYTEQLARIPKGAEDAQPTDPTWINDWFGGMDGVALYGFIANERPHTYIEIGSGVSTKYARRSIVDNGLSTRIVSIDPTPRAEIDEICDEVIRQPLEDVDLSVFDRLRAGDILFLDGSHRVFMNSDVVVFFLDILPRLPDGVLIHLHDILLPYDYFPEWAGRYYSEQYMLAGYLLGGGKDVDVVLPCAFVWFHPELVSVLVPLWSHPAMEGTTPHGASFWMRKR